MDRRSASFKQSIPKPIAQLRNRVNLLHYRLHVIRDAVKVDSALLFIQHTVTCTRVKIPRLPDAAWIDDATAIIFERPSVFKITGRVEVRARQ